jgi:iron complex outermembrane recepter protein
MSHRPLQRFLRFLFTATIGAVALCTAAFAARVKFDIAAQPIASALVAFSKQSGIDVLFTAKELKTLQAPAVVGEFKPEEALAAILAGSGYTAAAQGPKRFLIARPTSQPPGSIDGQVRDVSGAPVPNARVSLVGSDNWALTDRHGRFLLATVPSGAQAVSIFAEGMQRTRVTDVIVKPGHRHTLSSITIPATVSGITQLDDYVVSARKNDGVVELDPYSVEGRRERPFASGNMDAPRSINDAQPYYILGSDQIARSGAVDLEGFLKQHLTMNTSAFSSNQNSGRNDYGNTSSINLRGLGADKTLVLVNGRRVAGVTINDFMEGEIVTGQPDINGIPLAAVDRVEVLPSSASGIYGGSAIGGVVNVVLKRNYSGGEARMTYKNMFDNDAPARSASLQYGMSLENGRSNVSVSAAWSDHQPMIIADRYPLWERGIGTILRNNPDYFGGETMPPLGALPNIASLMGDPLVLRGGSSLGSNRTFVPAGTSPTTSAATLANSLRANAGQYNLEAPLTYQPPNGLLRPVGGRVKTEAYRTNFRREMLPWLELFAEHSYNKNDRRGTASEMSTLYIGADSPFNPFENDVLLSVPLDLHGPSDGISTTTAFTVGTLLRLPGGWTGNFDVTRSENRFASRTYLTDPGIFSAAYTTNFFVDPRLHPISEINKYAAEANFQGETRLDDFAFRAAGPLGFIPWGEGHLIAGIERRISETPANEFVVDYPVEDFFSARTLMYERAQVTDSVYAELQVPLLKPDALRFVHSLAVQISGRTERYEVDAGTQGERTSLMDDSLSYLGPTINGKPTFTKAKYTSNNGTLGLKYMPTRDVTLRASVATAFLPPRPDQLTANPALESPFSRRDPKLNISYPMATIGGGNPDLVPQNSESLNAGIIWQPVGGALDGLRANLEYYRIRQNDVIASLSGTTMLSLEDVVPGRVTRDPVTGRVTVIDTSTLNLFLRETSGWDASLDYGLKTGFGRFTFATVLSYLSDIKIQYSPLRPAVDAAGYAPLEEGAPKYKTTSSISWQMDALTVGWTTRFTDKYKQYGAAGGPEATRAGGELDYYIGAQGGDTVDSQVYHDLHVGYSFGSRSADATESGWRRWTGRMLDGVTVQLVINNVFDTEPPVDVMYGLTASYNFFLSPYGDLQMRNYALSIRKSF